MLIVGAMVCGGPGGSTAMTERCRQFLARGVMYGAGRHTMGSSTALCAGPNCRCAVNCLSPVSELQVGALVPVLWRHN